MKKTGTTVFKYDALAYKQRSDSAAAPSFILFHAPAGEIAEWADVDRTDANNPHGAQRQLRNLKVKKIEKFFKADRKNTIPTAIIVALDQTAVKGLSGGRVAISVESGKKPGLIIDGQHRVFGAARHAKTLNLNVVAFLGGDEAERAFQFVVINNTATRVSKDHIKALNLNFDQRRLNARLLDSAGVSLGLDGISREDLSVIDTSEPFKGLLKWPRNTEGFIPPNAIEGALAETRERAANLAIVDLERDVFLSIWTTIKEIRPDQWHSGSHLLEKVGIHALTVYILSSLLAAQQVSDEPLDLTDEDVLRKAVERMVGNIPPEFWTVPWKATELDTKAGRQILLSALETISSNVRHKKDWYESVDLVDASALSGASPDTKPAKSQKSKSKKK